MNKIKLVANRDTNYVFHMLSVARCGYDNEYGRRYRVRYSQEDLNVLKENENLITVRGGEHCGFLYGMLVGEPACGKESAKEYYQSLIEIGNAIKSGNVPDGICNDYIPYTDIIVSISEVMVKYYDDYIENVSALIEYVCAYLKAEGYEEASLTVYQDNLPAIHLYEKMGYCIVY